MQKILIGAVAGLIGLVALVVASHAHHGPLYTGGLVVFGLALVVIFRLIAVLTKQPPRSDELDPAQP